MVDHLVTEGFLPPVVFAPDGGPDFGYVEKKKGIATFTVTAAGVAAHASRPYLVENAIDTSTKWQRLYAFDTPRRPTSRTGGRRSR